MQKKNLRISSELTLERRRCKLSGLFWLNPAWFLRRCCREDIPLLIYYFLDKLNRQYNTQKKLPTFRRRAQEATHDFVLPLRCF